MLRTALGRQAGLQIGKTGDGPAMGVHTRMVKGAFKRAHDFLTQHMLNFLGIIVHVVGRNLCLVGKVQLPKAVISDNLTGTLPTFRRKVHLVTLLMQGGQMMSRQLG